MPLEQATMVPDAAGDAEQEYLWTLNFGPQHPATHTTLRILLTLDGERWDDEVLDILAEEIISGISFPDL